MTVVVLRGKTVRAKSRIRELGNEFRVIREEDRDGRTWIFVEPLEPPPKPYQRWVSRVDDPHFEIVETREANE